MAVDTQTLGLFHALVQNLSQLVQKTGSIQLLSNYTVAQAQSLTGVGTGTMIYVTDETGGAQPAFFDGSVFRRCTDRAVIS